MGNLIKSAAPIVGSVLGGPVGGAIGSAVAGGIGGSSSRQQIGTSTQTTDLPSYIKPAYETGVSEAERIYEEGGFGEYQKLSPYQLAQIERGMALSEAPSRFQQPAEQAAQQLLGGGVSFLSPAQAAYQQLQAMPSAVSQLPSQISGLLAPTREKIISQFSGGGRLGSGAFAESLGRGEAQALAPFLQAAQAQDIARLTGAAGGLSDIGRLGIGAAGAGIEAVPSVSQIPYSDVARGLELGGLLSAQDFAAAKAPAEALKEYTDVIRSLQFGSSQTTPLYGDVGGPSTGEKVLSAIARPAITQGIGALGGFLSGVGSTPPAVSQQDTGYRVPDMGTFLSDIGF